MDPIQAFPPTPVPDPAQRAVVPEKRRPEAPAPKAPAEERVEKPSKPIDLGPSTAVTFTLDQQLADIIIRVVNEKTGEVLRQIPPEERLRMQRAALEEQKRHAPKGHDELA